VLKRSGQLFGWAILSAAFGGVSTLALLHWRGSPIAFYQVNASTPPPAPSVAPTVELPRHYFSYDRWVELLGQEAKVVAEQRPPHLTILAGDSLSLWFPTDLLPTEFTWLNQGISGELSDGLLRRLRLFDATEPETIYIMIGINDLVADVSEATLLANHQEIIRHLKTAHPRARIVLQSILPHCGDRPPMQFYGDRPRWTERLDVITNAVIRGVNRQLAAIAKAEGIEYLDLHPHFADDRGNLQLALTTDGLHLSRAGYEVWRSHLQTWNQPSTKSVAPSRSS
jgi:lysophospholipase L1-like esterase